MKPNHERTDPWLPRLSEYLDGDLSRRERRRLEEHLRGCDTCADVLAALRGVTARAPALRTDSEPAADLWPGISARLAPRRPRTWRAWLTVGPAGFVPRFAFASLGLVAVAVVLVSVLSDWRHVSPSSVPPPPPAPASAPLAATRADRGPAAPPSTSRAAPHTSAPAADRTAGDTEYQVRIASLERQARAALTFDPRVVDVLEENLATLDVAIQNYREALAAEPGDAGLRNRLAAARERKLAVLQQAVALAAAGTN